MENLPQDSNMNQEAISYFEEIVATRRTVKPHSFSGAEIPRETVEKIMASTNWAPSHGRTEPWRFKVYSGSGKQTLYTILEKLYRETTPPEKFNESKLDKYRVNCDNSSHIVVIMMKRQKIERIPEIEEIEAVACAVQNLHLSATTHGVCGYWSSGSITYQDETRIAMGLEEKDRVLGFFYLGLPAGEIPAGTRQSDYQSKIEWIDK